MPPATPHSATQQAHSSCALSVLCTPHDKAALVEQRRSAFQPLGHSNLRRPNPGGNEFRCARSIVVGH